MERARGQCGASEAVGGRCRSHVPPDRVMLEVVPPVEVTDENVDKNVAT
jgi:hypothetical protein